jgi:prenylcysteine alpha-carboxyl methylesterase
MSSILRLLCWTVPLLLWDGIRLTCFVICLTPGFVRFTWYYFVAAHRTSIRFGSQSCRQTLDIYCIKPAPVQDEDISLVGVPVLVFYTGGAWIIGYKMWGCLLARALTAAGIMVVIPDMRNYPWASVPSMVEDVELSVEWTRKNIAEYGGDPDKIVLAGQSAGGHVVCTALLRMAMQLQQLERDKAEITENDDSNQTKLEEVNNTDMDQPWSPTTIKGFLSLSAPYNLDAMQESFLRHGLGRELVERIFGGETEEYDPYRLTLQCQRENRKLDDYLPPISIYHGTADKTAPSDGAVQFANELNKILGDQNPASLTLYEGWSHTDPILEGPMDADHRFHRDLFDAVTQWTDSTTPQLSWPEDDPIIKSHLCPHFLVQAGRFCMPF